MEPSISHRHLHTRAVSGVARSITVLFFAALIPLRVLGGAGDPLGGEFQVNTYTTVSQFEANIALQPNDEFVAVWRSGLHAGTFWDIVGQRFTSVGAPIGSEFLVNTYTTSVQRDPSVATDATGAFVVAWASSQDGNTYGVFAQRFASTGAAINSEFQVNTYTFSSQIRPSVGLNVSGEFGIVWDSFGQDGQDNGVFGQRFSSGGGRIGSEFQVNQSTFLGQYHCDIDLFPDGSFIVVWQSRYNGVFGRRYDSDGSPSAGEFLINTSPLIEQEVPAVSATTSEFVVVWEANSGDGSGWGILGQRFDSLGQKLGSEFQINSYTTGTQRAAAVASREGDGFVVAWSSFQQDGYRYGIFAQRFGSTGLASGTEFQVNSFTGGGPQSQEEPAIVIGNDEFIIVWESWQDGSQDGVFGHRFDSGDSTSTPTATSTGVTPNTPTSTSTSTQSPTATPVVAILCAGGPFSPCKTAGNGQFAVRNNVNDTKDRMKYGWSKGQTTSVGEYGDPTSSTQYSLCAWDFTAGVPNLVMDAVIPAGGNCNGQPCWRRIGTDRGFKFRDPGLLPHGIQKAVLKVGDMGRARVTIKGRGAMLPDIPMPVDQDTKFVAQLVNSAGGCWGVDFVTTASRNTAASLALKEKP